MIAKMTSKNQITLPVEAMRAAGFEPGMRLEVIVGIGGELLLMSATESRLERLHRSAGRFPGLYPPNYLEDLRRDEP